MSDNLIHDSSDFLMSIIGNSPNGIIIVNLDGRITIINKLAIDYLQLQGDSDTITDEKILDYLNDIPVLFTMMNSCLTEGRKPFDFDLIRLGDSFLTIKGRMILKGMILVIEDVTRLKNLEANALDSMLTGQEEERRRIAQEIHDGIGPVLSAVKMNLENTLQDIHFNTAKSEKQFKNSIELLDSATNDLRSISHDLLPSVLEDYGLKDGFVSLCERISETGKIQVDFYTTLSDDRMSSKLELGIYRIGQELINNSVKYSKAKKLMVQLIRHESSLVLMVEDNGVGFDKAIKTKGIGLANVRTRANALGGVFILDATPGKGVIATIEIPIN